MMALVTEFKTNACYTYQVIPRISLKRHFLLITEFVKILIKFKYKICPYKLTLWLEAEANAGNNTR